MSAYYNMVYSSDWSFINYFLLCVQKRILITINVRALTLILFKVLVDIIVNAEAVGRANTSSSWAQINGSILHRYSCISISSTDHWIVLYTFIFFVSLVLIPILKHYIIIIIHLRLLLSIILIVIVVIFINGLDNICATFNYFLDLLFLILFVYRHRQLLWFAFYTFIVLVPCQLFYETNWKVILFVECCKATVALLINLQTTTRLKTVHTLNFSSYLILWHNYWELTFTRLEN